jgi:hypothetical protein
MPDKTIDVFCTVRVRVSVTDKPGFHDRAQRYAMKMIDDLLDDTSGNPGVVECGVPLNSFRSEEVTDT